MDADVIEAVLRANNGAVDTTIDHLLAMSADGNDLKQDSDQPPPAYTGQPPSYQQATNEPVTDDLINLEGATGGTPIPKENANLAMDAATCIGCGACVATCKNSSAMLFVGAKISQYALLPQGQVEAKERAQNMVAQMDAEGFGNCTNTGACEVECPKGISLSNIARMNREFLDGSVTK